MPQYLKPQVVAGATTMFFAAVDLLKIPPYFLLGQFSATTSVSAGLIPVAVRSTFCTCLAGAPGVARTVLPRHPGAHLPHRSQIDS
jgi:hypothetical protein